MTFAGGTLRIASQAGATFSSPTNQTFTLSAAGGTIDVAGTSATINGIVGGGGITGVGALTVSGSSGGILYFDSNATSYTGGTTVTGGGTLWVTNQSSLVGGSALTVSGNGAAVFANNGQQLGAAVNNSGAATGLSFSATGGTITLASLFGTGTSLFNSGANIGTFTGGSATITGAGTIATYSGGSMTFAGVTSNVITTLTNTGTIRLGTTGTSLTASNGSYAGTITSTSTTSFNKGGSGSDTLTLTGPLSYIGATNVNAGTLAVNSILNSNSITVASVANFLVLTTSANGLSPSATLTASGNVAFNGAQTLSNLLGASTGVVNVSGVAFTLQSASYAGNITGTGGSLVLDGGSSAIYSFSSVNSAYTGGTTINSGTAFVSNGIGGSALGTGTVTVANTAALVTNGNTTISGAVQLNSGGSLYAGNSGLDVLNLTGGLTANAGSTLSFVMNGSSSVSSINLGSNTLNTTVGTVNISLTGAGLPSGFYPLFDYGSPLGANVTSSLVLLGAPANYSLDYTHPGLIDLSIANISSTLTWSATTTGLVDGSGNWNLASANFVNSASANVAYTNSQNNNVVFGAGVTGVSPPYTVTLQQDTTVGSIIFNPMAGDGPYTVTGSNNLLIYSGITANESATIGAAIALQQTQVWTITTAKTLAVTGGISAVGSVALTLQGPGGGNTGSFILSGNQTYAGTTTISGGAVVSLTGSLASGSVFIQGVGSALAAQGALNASVNMSNQSTLTIAGNQTLGNLTGAGTVDINGGTTLSISAGNFSGTLTDSGTLSATVGTVTLSGANGGFTGQTSIGGTGIVVLGNALALQNSTVNLGNTNGVSFAGGIGGFTIGGLVGSSNLLLQDSASAAVTLHVGNNGTSGVYGGGISGTGASFDKIGSGTLTLSGSSSYTGGTTVTGGILALDAAGSINNTLAITVGNGAALDAYAAIGSTATLTLSGTGTATFHGNQTIGDLESTSSTALVSFGANTLTLSAGNYAGGVSGVGGNMLINGSVTLSGLANVTGTTTVTNGALILTGTLTSPNVSISAGNSLSVLNDNGLSGTPTLVVASLSGQPGTAVFTGSQTLASLTGSGIIQIATSGKVLTIQAGSYGGVIGGSGSLAVNPGAGNTVTLSGIVSTYSGGTTIASGSLRVTGDLSLGAVPASATTPSITFSGTSTLSFGAATTLSTNRTMFISPNATATIDTSGGSVTTAAVIGGSTTSLTPSVLVKTGGNTLALTGTSTYNGGTIINGGTLLISTDRAFGATTGLPSTSITFSSNSTLTTTTAAVTILAARGISIAPGVTATFNTASATSILGVISGSSTSVLSKAGALTLTLAGNNSYAGGTLITGGTVAVGVGSGGNALGSGVVSFSSNTASLDLAGQNLTVANLASTAAASGIITNSGAAAANLLLNGSVTTASYVGSITDGTGKVGLNVSLSGTTALTLSGTANTFGNGLTLTSGILSVNNTGSIGTTTGGIVNFNGGTLQLFSTTFNSLAGSRTFNVNAAGGTISLASGVTAIVGNTVSGSGTLNIVGTGGTITFSGTGSAFTGSLVLNNAAGTETVKLGGAAPLGTAIINFAASNTVLDLAGVSNSIGNLSSSGGLGQVINSVAASSTLTVNGSGSSSYSGVIADGAATGKTLSLNIALTGGAALTLSGTTNTYSGGTTLTSGVLAVGVNGNLGTGGVTFSGGTLRLADGFSGASGRTLTLNNVAGNLIDVSGATVNGAGIAGQITGAGGLTISGSTGVLTLSGANNYSGGTTISAGVTVRAGSSTALGSSTVTFAAAGATLDLNAQALTVGGITSSGGVGTISNSNASAASLTLATAGTYVYGGLITDGTGTISLVVAPGTGSTTLTLSGANGYTGGTSIGNNATIRIGNTGSLGTGTVTFTAPNATLGLNGLALTVGNLSSTAGNGIITNSSATAASVTVNGSTSSAFGGSIANGTGTVSLSVALTGGSTLTLGGANTYTGGTSISSGTLNVSGSLATTGNVTLSGTGQAIFSNASGQQLATLNNGSSAAVGASFTGNSTLAALTGAGTTSFAANANVTTFNTGSVRVGGIGTFGTVTSGTLTFAGASASIATLNASAGTTISLSSGTNLALTGGNYGGAIHGAGGNVAIGGALTLSGASNDYSGTTNVNSGGSLFLTGSIANSAVSINTNGNLAGNGSIGSGGLTINGGTFDQSAFSPGGTASMAIGGNLTLSGGLLNFRLNNGGSDILNVSGNVVITSTTQIGIASFGSPLTAANYTIISAPTSTTIANLATELTFSATAITNLSNAHLTGSFVQSGGVQVDLVTTVVPITWTGIGGGSAPNGAWDTVTQNWSVNGGTPTTFINGDAVIFNDTASASPGTASVMLSTTISPASITVSNSALTYTIDSTGFSILTGSLLKDGTGTLNMIGSNAFNGGVTVNNGTLSVASISNGGANSPIGAASSLSAIALGTSTTTATFAFTGATGSTDRTFSLGSAGANVYVAATDNLTLSGTISGGALRVNGPGVLNLTAANSYTGTTTVSTGATLNLAGTGSIASSAIVVRGTLNVSSSAALTGNSGTPTVTVSNSAGILTLSNSQAMVLLDGGTGFAGTVNLANNNTLTLSAGTSFGGAIGGNGSVFVIGNTTLAGANTYSNGTTVNAGLLSVLSTGSLASGSNLTVAGGSATFANVGQQLGTVSVLNGTALSFTANTGTITIAALTTNVTTSTTSFASNANIAQIAAGTVNIAGDLTSTGSGVSGGNVSVGGVATLSSVSNGSNVTMSGATSSITSLNGFGTMTLGGSTNLTVNGGNFSGSFNQISGSSSQLTVTGGTFIFEGVNNLSGVLSIASTGTLSTGTQGALGTSNGLNEAVALASGGTLHITGNINDQSGVFTLSGGIIDIDASKTLTLSGANITGNVNQIGAGTLVILGAYSGTTNVATGGTYVADPATSPAVINVSLSNGATMSFSQAGTYNVNAVLAAGGTETISNTTGGVVTLTGVIDKSDANLVITGSGAGSYYLGATISSTNAANPFDSDMTFAFSTTIGVANTYAGPTTISSPAQNVTVTSAVAINALPAGTILNFGATSVGHDAKYDLNGNTQTLGGIVAWGTGNNELTSSSTSPGMLYVNVNAASFSGGLDSYSGKITGTLSMFKEGNGILSLTGTGNNYSGTTTIDAGTLRVGTNGALPSTTAVTISNSGILDVNGQSQTIGGLVSASSTATVTGGAGSQLTVSYSSAGSNVYAGQISGNVSLAFNGVANSSQILSGTGSDYQGTTAINSGMLLVNGSIVSNGGGTTLVTVSGGTLGGSGTIERNITVASGGTIAPGTSSGSTGTMTVGQSSTATALAINGTYKYDLAVADTTNIGSTSTHDQIAMLGSTQTLTLGSGSVLSLALANVPNSDAYWTTGHIWNLVTGSFGSASGTFTTLTDGTNSSVVNHLGGYIGTSGYFAVDYGTNNAVQLDWVAAVPEPGTMLLGTLAAMGLGGYGWRKRKKASGAQGSSEAV